jgi:subtilisin family serine protease
VGRKEIVIMITPWSLARAMVVVVGVAVIAGGARGNDDVCVWIHLRDKGADPPALGILAEAWPERSAARRRLRRTAPGLVDARDLPVHAPYVDRLVDLGARVRVPSRWLNAVSATLDRARVDRVRALDFVDRVEPVRRTGTIRAAPPPPGPPPAPGAFYGVSAPQITQIGLDALHDAGFTGAGVVVGILDTGFRRTHDAYTHPDHPLQVVAEWDFVNDDPVTAPEPGDLAAQHNHGTLILGVIAAYDPTRLVGGAYDAAVALAKVEDVADEYFAEEDFFVAGLEFLELVGADVMTSSVVIFDHYTQDELDGATSVMSVAYGVAAENGVHCFQGAGNEGHDADPTTSRLIPPADAFGVITVGSVDADGSISSFSSDGPSADGRTKPEVLTRGRAVATTDAFVDDGIAQANGTSLATPLAASVAACLVQAHPEWTVEQMRAALMRTASDHAATGSPDPLFVRGYGLLDAAAAVAETPARADLNGDFVVGVADLLIMLAAWGPCGPGSCPADLDDDGGVAFGDLLLLLAAWSPSV